MTPIGGTWTSPVRDARYFTEFLVEIPSLRASFTALVDGQEFPSRPPRRSSMADRG
jgi:hypothetical protein